ncbi:MAG: 30S ribosomal protein S12 methylthiotransferase RimO, partial [Thermoanaerobaculia bacterium]
MKIGFVSLGCPKNLVDGEVMLGYAQEAGYEITANPADADVIVVNTCAFIDNAKQESIDAILEMAQQKRDGKCTRLVVTGCLAERYRDELRKEIPEIDAVLGTGEVPGIVEAIGGRDASRNGRGERREARAEPLRFVRKPSAPPASRIAARSLPTYIYDAETPRVITTPKHFAYMKIAEGCDYTCAFCIIPTLRGTYRSRTR